MGAHAALGPIPGLLHVQAVGRAHSPIQKVLNHAERCLCQHLPALHGPPHGSAPLRGQSSLRCVSLDHSHGAGANLDEVPRLCAPQFSPCPVQ